MFKTSFIILFLLLSFLTVNGQTIDLPPNPKPGHCYVRCLGKDGKMSKWEDVNCAIIESQRFILDMDNNDSSLSKKDQRILDKVVKPFIEQNLTMELVGFYKPNLNDSLAHNSHKNKVIEVGNYFVQQGLKASLLKVKIQPSKSSKKNEFLYRAVNAYQKPCEGNNC